MSELPEKCYPEMLWLFCCIKFPHMDLKLVKKTHKKTSKIHSSKAWLQKNKNNSNETVI